MRVFCYACSAVGEAKEENDEVLCSSCNSSFVQDVAQSEDDGLQPRVQGARGVLSSTGHTAGGRSPAQTGSLTGAGSRPEVAAAAGSRSSQQAASRQGGRNAESDAVEEDDSEGWEDDENDGWESYSESDVETHLEDMYGPGLGLAPVLSAMRRAELRARQDLQQQHAGGEVDADFPRPGGDESSADTRTDDGSDDGEDAFRDALGFEPDVDDGLPTGGLASGGDPYDPEPGVSRNQRRRFDPPQNHHRHRHEQQQQRNPQQRQEQHERRANRGRRGLGAGEAGPGGPGTMPTFMSLFRDAISLFGNTGTAEMSFTVDAFPEGIGFGMGGGTAPGQGVQFGDYFAGDLTALLSNLMNASDNPMANPPASAEYVRSLPEVDVTEEDVAAAKDCSICMEIFNLGEKVASLPCDHRYHKDCILPWLQAHSTCPSCRIRVPAQQ